MYWDRWCFGSELRGTMVVGDGEHVGMEKREEVIVLCQTSLVTKSISKCGSISATESTSIDKLEPNGQLRG